MLLWVLVSVVVDAGNTISEVLVVEVVEVMFIILNVLLNEERYLVFESCLVVSTAADDPVEV